MQSRLLTFFVTLLRVLLPLNIVCGVCFLLVLVFTLVVDQGRFAAAIGPDITVNTGLAGIRSVLAIGVAAVIAAHVILRALRDITVTVRAGDPFRHDNAMRIRRIGWALLALQGLDLAFGALDHWLAARGLGVGGWTPSMTGWLAALAAFVLAEVFARGAAMRDDLAGTV